jgi:hypothetical protein
VNPTQRGLPAEPDCDEPASENRTLVTFDPVSDPSERQVAQRYADSLAQLVATKDQHPQTGQRCTHRTLVTESTAVFARLRAGDEHAAIPIDLDGLRATPRRTRRHHVVSARL